MDELFEEHLEIAKAPFAQRLPYWCDVFCARPTRLSTPT